MPRQRTRRLASSVESPHEGAGVADTLFGIRPFTGRLPVSSPRSLSQEPINKGDKHYDPLYRFGWGLTTG
jgi:beta-glucosidase